MKECENCLNECICNLCVCCRMFPCICSMRSKDFITDEELHKNCINKEKIIKYVTKEVEENFKLVNFSLMLRKKVEDGEFDNE